MTTSKKFRFVSPGVFISEIDKSQIPALPSAIGPVVIGRAQRGPGMLPVTVNNYLEFVDKFGEPERGVPSGDIWRNGDATAPLYAAYAAKAYLKNSAPLTFVRLVGNQSDEATAEGVAGWNTENQAADVSKSVNGGAYGLFIVESGSVMTNVTGALAAVFYLDKGAIRLAGNNFSNTSVGTEGAAVMVKSSGPSFEFRAVIEDETGNVVEDTAFNFNSNSSKYIRNVFNTNPTLTNDAITVSDALKTYFLGETFETSLRDVVDESAPGYYGFIAALQNGAVQMNNFEGVAAQPAKSGWIFSQDLNNITGSFDPENMTKLFRFVVNQGEGGEWEQRNVKVSLMDIKPSTNEFNKFGSFTVAVRDMNDTDANPVFLEMFTNCNLDPNSPDFIGVKIGDQFFEWDSAEKRHVKYGTFPNKSSYIRVELNPLIEQGGVAAEALPFGMFGPPVFKDINLVSGSVVTSSALLLGSGSIPAVPNFGAGSVAMPSGANVLLKFPTMKLRVSASDAGTLDPRDAFFGPVTNIEGSKRMNPDLVDLVRAKPAGVDSWDESAATQYSFIFTLDDVVAVSGTAGESDRFSFWQQGSRVAGSSITAKAAGNVSGSTDGYKAILDRDINRFTVPLFGASDGLDITEKDPFRNTLLAAESDETKNYAVYTLKKAVDTIRDAETLDCNIVAMPGITNPGVTKHLIDTVENRADALAIVDLPGGYVPAHENTLPESQRLGSVKSTVDQLRDRGLNSSYACTYYPWVKINDDATGFPLFVPPSVVALGTMASSQEKSEVWFAPAGFNRGGLTAGSAGLGVLDVREKLTSKQRDKLYENNVNPIASFPNEGIVIFGQKTLQVTQSALDRINVRRLMIYLKKEISRISTGVLFDQNVQVTWDRFKGQVNPFLASVQSRFGLSDFKVVLDESTTTADLVDRNILYAKIFLKPARSIEFIALDFIITRSGASFED